MKSLLANYPAYREEIEKIKECPYVVFDGNLVDVSNAVGSSAWEQLLFTVYHSYKQIVNGKSTSFMGTEEGFQTARWRFQMPMLANQRAS